ncbi:hypothetical protein PHYSODRAFT_323167 [Phytophthora sojae]|uniref:Transmembrane protein n=1 Tax=Phytophthora sojae (strain P6497) TaxID=1094619 RepID=G4YHU8_PHYSP|nr:hypothetical protein PHYSODRAFT_323167 [Phytophthora sojae]EGZ29675.1 hypothetical protein PHYSODRAFT_323167 [Phytophthora sojae]|eukprot:XP_009516950.1 hypothetical protein PHYSODRAFT_323167 [Phytophthora sojae]
MEGVTVGRVTVLLLLSPLPCLILAIMVESVPLAPPGDGVRANWVFLIRFGFVTGFMVGSLLYQMGKNVPALVAICFVIIWGEKFKSSPTIQKEMEQQTTVLNCQLSLTLVYPMYIYGFTSFTGVYQTIFVIVLPIIKLIAKNWISRALTGHNDLKPEAVIFNVEVFNALYISNALQVASTQASTITIMAVDFLHFGLSMYDVLEILHDVKALMAKIPEDHPHAKDNFVQLAIHLLEIETRHMSRTMSHFADASHPNWRAQVEDWVNSKAPTEERAHHYIVYNLHNRAYYPMLESLAPSEFISTLSHVLIYSSLEFVSLLVSIVVLKRTLGFSSLRQLSFVLENQAGIIQGKLLIHLIYIMQISLVHIGADFSFKFAWLHASRPTE